MKTKRVGKIGAAAAGAMLALGMGNAARNETPGSKDAGIKILSEAEAGQRGNVSWFSYNSGFYRLCSPIQAFGSYYQGFNYGFPASFYGYSFAPHILYQQVAPYAAIQNQALVQQNNYDRFGLNTLEPPIPNVGEPSMGEKLEQQMREQGKKIDELTRKIEEEIKEPRYIHRREETKQPSHQTEGKKRHRIEVRYLGHACDNQLDDVAIGDVYNPILGFVREESNGALNVAAYDEGWKAGRYVIAFKTEWSRRRYGEVDISDAFRKGITGPEFTSKLLEKMRASQVLGDFSDVLDRLDIGFRNYSCGQQ